QVIYISLLARENERFANNLQTLPVPRGLKANERKQYQALLAGRIATLNKVAAHHRGEVEKLFASSKALDRMLEMGNGSSYGETQLAARELGYALPYAPRGISNDIKKFIKDAKTKKPTNELQVAYLEQIQRRQR